MGRQVFGWLFLSFWVLLLHDGRTDRWFVSFWSSFAVVFLGMGPGPGLANKRHKLAGQGLLDRGGSGMREQLSQRLLLIFVDFC